MIIIRQQIHNPINTENETVLEHRQNTLMHMGVEGRKGERNERDIETHMDTRPQESTKEDSTV